MTFNLKARINRSDAKGTLLALDQLTAKSSVRKDGSQVCWGVSMVQEGFVTSPAGMP